MLNRREKGTLLVPFFFFVLFSFKYLSHLVFDDLTEPNCFIVIMVIEIVANINQRFERKKYVLR